MNVKKIKNSLVFFVVLLVGCNANNEKPIPIEPSYDRNQVLAVASRKYLAYAINHNPADGHPRSAENSQSAWPQSRLNWTSGFFPGVLWQLAYFTGQAELYQQSQRWTLPLDRGVDWPTHDIGFLIDYSFGKGGRITGDISYDSIRLEAANNLIKRYNPNVKAIRSWNSETGFTVIIDNMMNLSLLFDSAKHFSDNHFYETAFEHMITTASAFIREDGSSFHVVNFNEDSGEIISQKTSQGLNDRSTWARGQAWGIYGFTLAYRETGSMTALNSAVKMANYYLDNLPDDNIPNWDFNATGKNTPKDSSSSTIAAAALWLLSEEVEEDMASRFKQGSLSLIDALLNDEYLIMDNSSSALLKHATGNKPADSEVDVSLIYADYYLVEAILLQQGIIQRSL